jgi:hypothetical protein
VGPPFLAVNPQPSSILWISFCAIMAVGDGNAAPRNPGHELLLSKSAAGASGNIGKGGREQLYRHDPVLMGIAEDGSAFWSVLCANGNSYIVQVSPDAVGTAKALECSRLKAMHLDCFSLLPPEALHNPKSGIASATPVIPTPSVAAPPRFSNPQTILRGGSAR